MKAVELFCGIGGFRVACDELGIETIWANDIDSSACSVYRNNFGEAELVEGDINSLHSQIPDHDLLTGGFPCQPFSSAGKKEGIQDSRGTLFRSIVEVLREKRPQFFVLENVKRLLSMQKGVHFATILNELSHLGYSVEWRLVKASELGLPQHRERVFIVGTLGKFENGSSCIKLLSADDAKCLNGKQYDKIMDFNKWSSIEHFKNRFGTWGIARNGKFVDASIQCFAESVNCAPFESYLEDQVDPSFDFTENTLERIKESTYVNKYFNGVQILYNQGGGARMGYTIFGTSGIAPTLTATASRHYERYKIGEKYRRLTNVEYARLQGFPDDHCSSVTVYNQYALYGNAVPPIMAKWAISKVTNCEFLEIDAPKERQLSLLEGIAC